jgi:hypothetical protein
MSFEDLQKKWGSQFPVVPPNADTTAEARLLKQIRRQERGFRGLVIAGVIRDLLLFSVAFGTLMLVVRHGLPFPKEISKKYRPFAVAGGGGAILLTIIVARCRLWLIPSSAGSPASLPDMVLRDSGRFDALVLWSDSREVLSCAMIIFLAVFQAMTLPAGQYASLAWIAAGLFGLSTVSYLIYRHRSKALSPQWNGTVLGMLALSIHQTCRRIRLLENLWWYILPLYLGLMLLRPIRLMLMRGRVRGSDLIDLAVSAAMVGCAWGLNLWVARRRLRPRLQQLQQLQAEFSPESQRK